MFSSFLLSFCFFFFFNDTATTEIYTLSLHDALPILCFLGFTTAKTEPIAMLCLLGALVVLGRSRRPAAWRSEEHTSELQSRLHLVCRLLLEKKKNTELRMFLYPSNSV